MRKLAGEYVRYQVKALVNERNGRDRVSYMKNENKHWKINAVQETISSFVMLYEFLNTYEAMVNIITAG